MTDREAILTLLTNHAPTKAPDTIQHLEGNTIKCTSLGENHDFLISTVYIDGNDYAAYIVIDKNVLVDVIKGD